MPQTATLVSNCCVGVVARTVIEMSEYPGILSLLKLPTLPFQLREANLAISLTAVMSSEFWASGVLSLSDLVIAKRGSMGVTGSVKLVEALLARGWEVNMSWVVVLAETPIDGTDEAATAVSTIACQSLILRGFWEDF